MLCGYINNLIRVLLSQTNGPAQRCMEVILMITVILSIILLVYVVFCIVALILIHKAHQDQFKRADYGDQGQGYPLYFEDFSSRYPREALRIPADSHALAGFVYGSGNKNGLIIMSSGHRCSTDVQLQSMKYFVDHGWMVICYDYTGCYCSEGGSMIDYTQSVRDLDAVLTFIENSDRFRTIPLFLYGHSLGAYASAAVLNFNHRISAVVAASGFDKPTEQWAYSVKRFSGKLGALLGPMAAVYLRVVFGRDTKRFSAVIGINSVRIPVLVISGTSDVFYGGQCPIYVKKKLITNPNCTYMLMNRDHHNGHYDYMLTDRALEYQSFCQNNPDEIPDKWIIMEHDSSFFDQVNAFFISALQGQA